MNTKRKVGVLVSGRGTNLQALIDACIDPEFPAEIALVISNKKDAFALERAAKAGVPSVYISHKDYDNREAFDQAMHHQLLMAEVELVCMAGFMRLLSPWFVQQWYNQLVNIHPSLLPAFKGLHAQQQALDYGVKVAGCTVHFVRTEMDVGPIIMQRAVNVSHSDTVEALSRRILSVEHVCYIEVLRAIAEGRVTLDGEHVHVREPDAEPSKG